MTTKRVLVGGAICQAPIITPTALKFFVVWNQFLAGFHAYNQGRGPGGTAMYYIICDGTVVDSSDSHPRQEELQQWANDLNAPAYVIRGEHYGVTVDPESDEDEDTDE